MQGLKSMKGSNYSVGGLADASTCYNMSADIIPPYQAYASFVLSNRMFIWGSTTAHNIAAIDQSGCKLWMVEQEKHHV